MNLGIETGEDTTVGRERLSMRGRKTETIALVSSLALSSTRKMFRQKNRFEGKFWGFRKSDRVWYDHILSKTLD